MPDLAIFSQTRIQNQLGITDYIDDQCNSLLNQFITDIPLFINVLECTGSVISGSSAVNLILPKSEEFKIDNMDIYTTEKYAEVVIEYLKKEESHEVNKRFKQKTEYDNNAIKRVVKLKNGKKKIDVMVTHWNCAIIPILQFHSTLVMNCVTAHTIVSMYPDWTCARKGFVHPQMYLNDKSNTHTVEALMKYTHRGFKLFSEPFEIEQHECNSSATCPHTMRTTIDQKMFHWNVASGLTFSATTLLAQTCLSLYGH
ncbi:hypothetical protein BD769DRAFT_1365826 [Suillus cothurnatus]|nr:hypothetical protein BD769DRAFT_1365826 [Suillus cothurnatus]